MRRVATSWKVIAGVLKEHVHSAYKALRPPALEERIGELEDMIGGEDCPVVLPTRSAYTTGCGRADLINYKSLLPVTEIRNWWRVQCGVQRECGFGGNLYTRTRKVKNDARWRKGWVPRYGGSRRRQPASCSTSTLVLRASRAVIPVENGGTDPHSRRVLHGMARLACRGTPPAAIHIERIRHNPNVQASRLILRRSAVGWVVTQRLMPR